MKKIPKGYCKKLDGKYVFVRVLGITKPVKEMYQATWDGGKWVFMDDNCVTCEEWNGQPTHYKLVND